MFELFNLKNYQKDITRKQYSKFPFAKDIINGDNTFKPKNVSKRIVLICFFVGFIWMLFSEQFVNMVSNMFFKIKYKAMI